MENTMENTTNINELPLNPPGNNISFVANEISSSTTTPSQQSSMTLDQSTINQIVSGLQQASVAGATQLPSRDIPRVTEQLTNDEQVQPNFIQQKSNVDYIKTAKNTPDEIVEKYIKTEHFDNTVESVYDELQTPLLLTVLYFIFQLPIFKKYLYNYLPVLFSKDGNINLNGLAFTSIMYGVCYYFINKSMMKINTF
jgi:hypothetical protein